MTNRAICAIVVLCAAAVFAGCRQEGPAVTAAAPAATPAASPAQVRYSYTVAADDKDFRDIAEKVYGDGKYWNLIHQANPSVDPTRLRAGQVLKILPASQRGRVIIPKHCNCQ